MLKPSTDYFIFWVWNVLGITVVSIIGSSRILGYIMTSSNGNIFRVTGPLWWEPPRWPVVPLTKASDAEHWRFLWCAPFDVRLNNNRDAGDLRRHRVHYDVTVMFTHNLYGGFTGMGEIYEIHQSVHYLITPGRFEWNLIYVIFRLILGIDGWGISCEIVLRWTSLNPIFHMPTLGQVMVWCRQVTSHYLSQCWPDMGHSVKWPWWIRVTAFRITGSLWGEFTGYSGNPVTKGHQ